MSYTQIELHCDLAFRAPNVSVRSTEQAEALIGAATRHLHETLEAMLHRHYSYNTHTIIAPDTEMVFEAIFDMQGQLGESDREWLEQLMRTPEQLEEDARNYKADLEGHERREDRDS